MFIEATTLGDLVERTAATRGHHRAIVFPDAELTYAELAALTTRYARSLRALGVAAQDKVGILMPNRIEFVAALIGAAKIGAVPVPINGRFKAHELGHVLKHADIRVLMTAAGPLGSVDYPALIAEMLPAVVAGDPMNLQLDELPELRQIVDVSGARTGFIGLPQFDTLADRVQESEIARLRARVRIRDVAMLMYTSGTTSKPKGCLLTHEAIVRHGINVARSRFLLTEEDKFWDPLPLFHIGGIVPMLGVFGTGGTYFHAGHFDATQALDTLERERITVAYPAFETIWLQVLDHPRFAQADLSALRLIQSVAIPERLRQMYERLPTAVQVSSFGATECSSNLTLPLPDESLDVRINTLGSPLPGMAIMIADPESGVECASGQIGELLLRGYARFEGYYKDPEQTAAVINAEGWFRTGDLGWVDRAGNFCYSGRLKDMLKVGGENVSAVEIEDYVARHPAVQIVQVVSAPDAHYTEVPVAFIQLRADVSGLTEAEIIAFCVGRIATYKVPRYVRFISEWPMSGTKIQKFALRERIADELKDKGITQAPRIESRALTASTR